MRSVTENGGRASDVNRQATEAIADGVSDDNAGEALKQVIVVDTERVGGHLNEVVRSTVDATLNQLLDEEADRIAGAGKYERSPERKDFSREHRRCIKTNNPLERLNREVRRRTRVVGAFPDGQSALMLEAARLRHVAGTRWGTRRYLDMSRLREMDTARAATMIEAPQAAAA